MNEPRIVTPEEARGYIGPDARWPIPDDFAHTVATEPDRIRVAVVKALRTLGDDMGYDEGVFIHERADTIENGADF